MRKQVGWYWPSRELFCYLNQKQEIQGCEEYIVPVFADDGLDQTYLWHEIQLQILENQKHFLQQQMKIQDLPGLVTPTVDLVTETDRILKKGKESL